tara:strand:- start:2226 stop:2795 length:570 start_codon:yes stop_codon:yes gene_type:complete
MGNLITRWGDTAMKKQPKSENDAYELTLDYPWLAKNDPEFAKFILEKIIVKLRSIPSEIFFHTYNRYLQECLKALLKSPDRENALKAFNLEHKAGRPNKFVRDSEIAVHDEELKREGIKPASKRLEELANYWGLTEITIERIIRRELKELGKESARAACDFRDEATKHSKYFEDTDYFNERRLKLKRGR